jgi:hypothetical protein
MKTKIVHFVILRTQRGGIIPLVQEDGELALFDSRRDAERAAINNPLGAAFGSEEFEMEIEAN